MQKYNLNAIGDYIISSEDFKMLKLAMGMGKLFINYSKKNCCICKVILNIAYKVETDHDDLYSMFTS